jgi:4-hydroxybenzoate polyprenyltransferase
VTAPRVEVPRAARLLWSMSRPPVAVVLFSFAGLGMAQAGGRDPSAHGLTLAAVLLVVTAWFVHAGALNDLADEDIDRVNLAGARGRPLVSGDATRAELSTLGAVSGLVALGVAWALDWRIGVVVTVALALNAAYSVRPVRISDRGVVASLLLPAGYVALPFLTGTLAVDPHLDRQGLVLLAGLYVVFVGRILLKDFRDVEGDARFGKRTFLLRHGRRATCRLSAGCWVAGSAAVLMVEPVRSVLVVLFAGYLAGALYALRLLERSDGFASEQVTVAAVARMGMGMVVTLTAHYSLAAKGWPAAADAAILIGVAGVFVSLYATALRDRHRVVALRLP